jgi:hypothetical protein
MSELRVNQKMAQQWAINRVSKNHFIPREKKVEAII